MMHINQSIDAREVGSSEMKIFWTTNIFKEIDRNIDGATGGNV
jgi:hypothetical protein